MNMNRLFICLCFCPCYSTWQCLQLPIPEYQKESIYWYTANYHPNDNLIFKIGAPIS